MLNQTFNVPKLRFGEFEGEWVEKKLEEISKITMGQSPKSSSYNKKNIGIPLIQGNADCKNRKTVPRIYTSEATKKCFTDDIIMTVRAPVGAISKSFHNACIGRGVCAIQSNQENDFIYQFLIRYEDKWKTYSQGSTFTAVNSRDVKNLKIKLPSELEQKKIATYLTSIDKKIEQLNQKRTLLESYKKGVMQKIFSREIRFKRDDGGVFEDWEEKMFKDIVINYRLGGNYANSENKTDFPLIKMGNLGRGKINLNKLEYIKKTEKAESIDRIKYGDLFFNTRNTLSLVGKVSIWKNELPQAYYNSNLMSLQFDNNFFMNYRFNSFDGMKALKSIATGTTSVAAIYTKDLLQIKLLIPSLEEQQKISNFLTSIDQKITQNNQALEEMKAFKKGLLQQMFV